MAVQTTLFEEFRKNAELVSAKVCNVRSVSEATDYLTGLAQHPAKEPMVIAAPEFNDSQLAELQRKAVDVHIIQEDLSSYSTGIPFAVTFADYGIADTGTLVIDSTNIEKRLATMIPDIHIAILPESRIVATSEDLIPELNRVLSQPSGYLAFVTGASRTADIERVLVVGVHGPLELHILVIEDN